MGYSIFIEIFTLKIYSEWKDIVMIHQLGKYFLYNYYIIDRYEFHIIGFINAFHLIILSTIVLYQTIDFMYIRSTEANIYYSSL